MKGKEKMEKRTLAQAKELVKSSFSTILKKKDVMKLLESIEVPQAYEELSELEKISFQMERDAEFEGY
jgi:hypothetical protein